MSKVPVLSTKDFVFYIEDYQGANIIHCDVLTKWTKTVKEHLQHSFKEVANQYHPLYAFHTKTDLKHEKFLKMLDFTYLKTVIGLDNNEYDIYVWR